MCACWLAWRFGEASQHSVAPQFWHVRKWTHSAPIFTHSSHSRRFGCLTVAMAVRWEHVLSDIVI